MEWLVLIDEIVEKIKETQKAGAITDRERCNLSDMIIQIASDIQHSKEYSENGGELSDDMWRSWMRTHHSEYAGNGMRNMADAVAFSSR